MGVLDKDEAVVLSSLWNVLACSDSNIDDEATLILLGEESVDGVFLCEVLFWHWTHPDCPVNDLLVSLLNLLEHIDVDLAQETNLLDSIGKGSLMEISQKVVLHEDLLELSTVTISWDH